jgi:tetratricopeptide (TPR) repeat protein
VRGKLVGRMTELQQLKQHWAQAQQARGHLVLLSGEPGVGKTRLAEDLIAHARASGAMILRGGCYEYEATTPYLPVVEAFREWAHWQSPDALREKLGATAQVIAKFAPEIEAKLGVLAPNPPLSPNEERLRLFDNAARFLQSLAADRGLLLFIDDVHWADQGTLSLMHYVLRHLRNDRVLMLAAYREIELDRAHPLASALVDWNRERLTARMRLGRLSQADTAALLAALFGQDSVAADFAGALFRETEGNPFFVEEVVKSLIELGQIYREEGSWVRKETHELAIPQSVKEAIGRRLNRLSETAVDALRTAAALGKIFSFQELAAVSTAGDDALLDALDEAASAQLIRANGAESGVSSGGDDTFAFTHDKIREVLYEELNPIRRRRLHQRIAETLEKLHAASARGSGDHAQDLAYHFSQAGDLARSLTHSLLAAANARRVFAHDEAQKYLEQARESAEALNRMDDLAAIDEQIGDIHETRGVTRQAVESYERALAEAKTREARAAIKAKIGSAWGWIGEPRGLAYLEEALAELDPATQANALALATAFVGRYYHYRAEHSKAIEYLERARLLAEPQDDPETLVNIYGYLAGAHQHLLHYDESDRWARISIELGERRRFPQGIALGYEFLAENATGRGGWDDAVRFGARDAEEGRKIGALARVAWSGFPVSLGLQGKGDLAGARATVREALSICEQIGEGRLATWLVPMQAIIAADLGEADSARALAEQGWERARQLDQLVLSAWALNALGYAAILRGDIAAALEWYRQYVLLIRDTENGVVRNSIMARAAEAFLLAGRLDDAAQLIEQALSVSHSAGAIHFEALARCVEGRLLAARDNRDGAQRAFDEAIAGFVRTGSRLELARALYHRAVHQRGCGHADAARADALRARDEFAAMGAARDRALADELVSE